MTDDPFAKLFLPIDARPFHGLMADTLYPLARFDSAGYVELTADGEAVSAKRKVLIGLLMRKVEFVRGTAVVDAIGPHELSLTLHVPGNTVRPALLRLEQDGLIALIEHGLYTIPNVSICAACRAIGGKR
jgi:hypothetical protein